MNKLVCTPRRIGYSRLVRPLVDGLLLLLTFYFFLEVRAVSLEQNLAQKQKASLQKLTMQNQTERKKTQQHPALFIEEHHSSEAAMWQSWKDWLQSTHPITGHCLFETRDTAPQQPFYMLCFGNSPGKNQGNNTKESRLNLADGEGWFPNRLFVEPKGADAKLMDSLAERTVNSGVNSGTQYRTDAHIKPRAEQAAAPPTAPTYKVEGWINTSQGQMKFDPVQKKWVP